MNAETLFAWALLGQALPPAEGVGLGVAWGDLLRAAITLAIGLPVILVLSRWVRTTLERRSSPQHGMVAGKAVFYPGVIVLLITVLGELGFGLAPILGAAGVVGIAIGFASQTSVSNVISGLFLIAERPFQVNDLIQVGNTTGRVLSIDTLSIKLRTFDNRYVRIPNETIVKSEVTTITRFPIRRLDLNVGIGYSEDVARVRRVLLEVVAENPIALVEPAPAVFIDGYGASSIDLRLAVWVTQEAYGPLKIALLEAIKARFDREGIEIPWPHRTLVGHGEGGALLVRLDGAGAPPDPRDATPPVSGSEPPRASREEPESPHLRLTPDPTPDSPGGETPA